MTKNKMSLKTFATWNRSQRDVSTSLTTKPEEQTLPHIKLSQDNSDQDDNLNIDNVLSIHDLEQPNNPLAPPYTESQNAASLHESNRLSSDSERPTAHSQPLTRKRSRRFQLRRSKPKDTDNKQQRQQQKQQKAYSKSPYLPMASKDPVIELRRIAATRSQLSQDALHSPTLSNPQTPSLLHPGLSLSPTTSPSGSAHSKNNPLAFLSIKQRNRKSFISFLGDKSSRSHTAPPTVSASPRPSTSRVTSSSHTNSQSQQSQPQSQSQFTNSTSPSQSLTPNPTFGRTSSVISDRSTRSSPQFPNSSGGRNRSFTGDSTSGRSEDTSPTPYIGQSGRNSTSTAGRSSFSNLFHFGQRMMKNPDSFSPSSRTPQSCLASGSNSMSISREKISLPNRKDGETAKQFLERLEIIAVRSQIAALLSETGEPFHAAVMRSFMRTYALFGDPLDMALRRLLIEVVLPKETQHIDRLLQAFADRYHECNPGIFSSVDAVHISTFSILMLHTDAFNKSNRRKMSKADYFRNLRGQGICNDVLSCFYDNIVYTPFIHIEDDQDLLTMRKDRKAVKAAKAAKLAIKNVSDPNKKTLKEPLDPYTLILESRLDTLRPLLKNLELEDTYSYLGSLACFNSKVLRNCRVGYIQIESSRSRPDAFMSPSGIENPQESKIGLVSLPVNKVGLLWRKDPKKKKARSPWQERGAILTSAGVYFFKNAGWVKDYFHQYHSWVKHSSGPCIFKPSVASFKPDQMMPTDHGVALQDASYKKHKHAFTFFRHNNSEEVFLAQDEADVADWMARLNHQAACKTADIKQRGAHTDAPAQQSLSSSTSGITSPPDKAIPTLAQQISQAKQKSIEDKLKEMDEKIKTNKQQLDTELRDARHLFILAPILRKGRDELELSAERLNRQLKWSRVEAWRLKCHRDILQMELDEENKDFGTPRLEEETTLDPADETVIDLNQPLAAAENDGGKCSYQSADRSVASSIDQVFHTPLEVVEDPSRRHSIDSISTASSATIPSKKHAHKESVSSHLQPAAPRSSLEECLHSPDRSQQESSEAEAENKMIAEAAERPISLSSKAGSLAASVQSTSDQHLKPGGQPLRSALSGERSIQSSTSQRFSNSTTSVNGDAQTTAGANDDNDYDDDDDNDDNFGEDLEKTTILKREHDNFTLHGKKASVITFVGDWANNAEETLERIKASTLSPARGKSLLGHKAMSLSDDGEEKDGDTIKGLETCVSITPTPGSPHADGMKIQAKSIASRRISGASSVRPNGLARQEEEHGDDN